ncbi:MAG: hypothetical protein HY063_01355 [Bacteroidetes bacterium]|nr:hypothetical protein [Bacteroidota bacterium]
MSLFPYFLIPSQAQSVYAPLNSDYEQLPDRYEIKSKKFSSSIFTSCKPYTRKDIALFADTLAKDSSLKLSKADRKNIEYLQADNYEWSKAGDSGNANKTFLKLFYKKKNSFYSVNEKYFNLQVNPVTYFSAGMDNNNWVMQSIYINSRGAELRGTVDKKVGFYFFLTDNQAGFPSYVNGRINSTYAVPGEGFWTVFKRNDYDFYTARGYVSFNITKHIRTQFGQDKNFIGNGYRSLLLSDYSANYLFWKMETKIWRFHYTNLFADLTASTLRHSPDTYYPRKFMTLHYLSINLARRFNVGLFESITFGNTDSINNRGFDYNYLNPIIFYKAVENGLGAPDKAHIGFDFKWNFARHFSAYGTLFIDEFLLSEIKAQRGWWGNKQAVQFGMKYVDVFGIKNLDVQGEVNMVRPYVYTHFSFSTYNNYSYYSNYSNYEQPLAHPLGANFYEAIGILRWQPFYKFSFTGKLFYTIIGLDSAGKNFGSNILLPYQTRAHEYYNFIGQGARSIIQFASASLTYQIMHNMFADVNVILRNQASALAVYNSNATIVSVSFRWNIAKRLQEF